MYSVKIDTAHLVHWFNTIRGVPDSHRNRLLDAFWGGQLQSKAWLSNTLNTFITAPSNVYIFGGWVGVLSNIIITNSSFPVLKVRSIDIDPWCEPVADSLNKEFEMDGWRFKARTSCMSEYSYEWCRSGFIEPHIVINTSTEHIRQDTYDTWLNNIPAGATVVVQGNNYFSHPEHIRCSKSLDSFLTDSGVIDPVYTGEFTTPEYTRYMAIWKKSALPA